VDEFCRKAEHLSHVQHNGAPSARLQSV